MPWKSEKRPWNKRSVIDASWAFLVGYIKEQKVTFKHKKKARQDPSGSLILSLSFLTLAHFKHLLLPPISKTKVSCLLFYNPFRCPSSFIPFPYSHCIHSHLFLQPFLPLWFSTITVWASLKTLMVDFGCISNHCPIPLLPFLSRLIGSAWRNHYLVLSPSPPS